MQNSGDLDTPEEIAEYKRICGIIGCLATIRSRHVSSAEWIKKWGALLKPENLKIKTVNELDVLLGYDLKDLGSVIFRKPELVKNHFPKSVTDDIAAAAKAAGEATGRPQGSEAYRDAYNKVLKARRKAIVGPEARNFALSKGFKEGTKEYAEAVKRIEDRTDELAVAPYAALGEDGCDRLRALGRDLSRRVVDAGQLQVDPSRYLD